MPSGETIDCRCLSIHFQPSDAETAEWLNRLLEIHQDARTYTRGRTPDAVVVATDDGGVVTIPAVVFPTERPGDVEIDLFGAGEVLPFTFPHTPTTTPILTHSGWVEYCRDLLERNQFLGLRLKSASVLASPVARCPSALASVVSAFHPVGRSMDARIASVTDRYEIIDVPVRGSGLRSRIERVVTVDLTADGQDRRSLQTSLPDTSQSVSGSEHDRASLVLERLGRLDSETLKTYLALVHVGHIRQSRVIGINVSAADKDVPAGAALISWAELGRQQGWDRLNVRERRGRLGEALDLLLSIRFSFDVKGPGGWRLSDVPLLHKVGNVERDHQRFGVVLAFNELMWKGMVEQQLAVFYDKAILATTPLQDWHLRIYFHLFVRLSRSWITQSLGDHGGRLTMRLGSLLDGAGLDYQHQLQKQGPGWLRRKVRTVLAQLKAPQWDGRALLAKYTYKESPEDVLQDTVTIWPPAVIIGELNQHRSKSMSANVSRRRGLKAAVQEAES